VFFEYGDDSVAQLGGVHLACEQASNLLTKVLEWGRLMSYLEQSTRYIAYDARLGGRYRFFRDPAILASPLGTRYVGDMDRMFDTYAELLPRQGSPTSSAGTVPRDPADSDFVYRQATGPRRSTPCAGCCRPRRCRTSASTAGPGATRRCCCACVAPAARGPHYADLMLHELRKVIPSFLRASTSPTAAVAWSTTWPATRTAMDESSPTVVPGTPRSTGAPAVTLVDFDPDAEDKLLAAMLLPHTHLPETSCRGGSSALTVDERLAVMRPTWASAEPPPQARAGRSSGSTTASTC
jgi:hypothetical protein